MNSCKIVGPESRGHLSLLCALKMSGLGPNKGRRLVPFCVPLRGPNPLFRPMVDLEAAFCRDLLVFPVRWCLFACDRRCSVC